MALAKWTDLSKSGKGVMNFKWIPIAAMVLGFLCTQALLRADEGGRTLLEDGPMRLTASNPAMATVESIGDGPKGIKSAVRIHVLQPTTPFYHIQFAMPINQPIASGDLVEWRFWARSSTSNPVRAVVELSESPWNALADISETLTPQWKRYGITVTTQADFPAKHLSARFQVGHQIGLIDLAGVELRDLGPDPRIAVARAALEPDAIAKRIRKYRMGDLVIKVVDAQGRPTPNVDVHVEQVRHAFLFGSNIFELRPADSDPLQIQYQQRFVGLLNYATLPFYWGAFEPAQGAPQFARLDAMAAWGRTHGLTLKGHPLVWHEVYPDWAPPTPDLAVPLLRKRVLDIIRHYQHQIDYFDVLNEANAAAFTREPNGESEWIKRDGAPLVVGTAVGWAREATNSLSPKPTLIYNDYEVGAKNIELLNELKARGTLPDVIGIQSHMHSGRWPLTKVWQVCEDFSQFGLPLHFTEVTVLSAPSRSFDYQKPPMDWLSTSQGEIEQAEYVSKFYSLLFSHPSVRAITWWDLSDRGAWLNAPAGLIHKDMTPKPAYDALMKLIHGAWWTDSHGTTAGDGTVTIRAFYGDLRITPAGGAPIDVSLPAGTDQKTVVVQFK